MISNLEMEVINGRKSTKTVITYFEVEITSLFG